MSLPAPTETQAIQAANILLEYAKNPHSRSYTELELGWIDKAITQGQNAGNFDRYAVEIIKTALCQRRNTRNKLRKNFELVLILLRNQTSEDLFRHCPEILCLALKKPKAHMNYIDELGATASLIIEPLIDRGAKVNHQTEQGQTPLLYSCWNGSAHAYFTLLKAGADFTTIHKARTEGKSRRVFNIETDLEKYKGTKQGSFNLLYVALSRWARCNSHEYDRFAWKYSLDKNWGLIITDLLERGLEIDTNNPMLIKFFYIAIMQGRIDLVKALLSRGVPLEGVAERYDRKEQFLGSALQAAASSGQGRIVKLLLDHGADPRSLTQFGGSNFYDKQPWVLRTAVDAALLFRMTPGYNHTTEQLQACMVLVETSESLSDGLLLLKACINARHLDLTKRLLDQGFRIERYPIDCCRDDTKDEDFELIELLEQYNIPLDMAALQLQAAESGQLKLLWLLVSSAGPQIPHDKLDTVISKATTHESYSTALLRYLILEYGLKVNEVIRKDCCSSPRTILWRAVKSSNPEAVRFLLEQGADITYPGTKQTILSKLKERLGLGRYDLITQEEVSIIRLLAEAQFSDLTQEQRSATDMWTLLQMRKTITSEFWTDCQQEQIKRIRKPYITFYIPGLAPAYGYRSNTPNFYDYRSITKVHQYETLRGLKPIRLLTVERAEYHTQLLSCSLSTVEVFEATAFEVLSCCDANPTIDQVDILLNGKFVSISRGLQEALINLRHPDQERTLWVEALCIDAASDSDKTQQRTLMPDIFTRAEQTICWLGESTKDTDELFNYLQKWTTDQSEESHPSRYPLLIGRRHIALQTLMTRPWFWSTWRIAEFALSKKPVIMCGHFVAHWNVIGSVMYNEQTEPHRIWQSMLGVHEKYWWRCLDILTNGCLDPLKKAGKLSSYFEIMAITQASDARDKLFAIQIILDLYRYSLPIDYGMSIKQIYQNFTKVVIQKSNSLQILHWLGSSRKLHDLPSWVPDYSICKPISVLPRCFSSPQKSGEPEPPQLPLLWIINDEFHATGKGISRVKNVGREMILSMEHSENIRHLWEIVHDWEALVANDLPESKWHGSIKRFLETLSTESRCEVEWYRTFCLGLLEKADPQSIKEHDDFMAVKEWAGIQGDKEALSDFTDRVRSVCPGRRFVILENGMMGLAHPDVCKGDQLIGLAGALYPFIVRPTGDTTFQLIGDCYLSEFDNNELSNYEEIAVEEFCLR